MPDSYSIEEILEKAKTSVKNQDCYRQMREIAEKYKEQSLNKRALLRESLKSKDIINCKEITRVKNQQALNSLVLSMCYQAQIQKQKQEKAERARQTQEEEKQSRQAEPARQGDSGLSDDLSTGAKALQDQGKVSKKTLGNQKNNAENEKLQSSQKEDGSGDCPIAFSDIKPTVVYQSVEAPQIEPLRTFKTLKDHYRSYDLVKGKPAVVLLNIKQTGEIKGKQKYSITLKDHSREPAVTIHTRCSDEFIKPDFELDEVKKSKDKSAETRIRLKALDCDFKNSHLQNIKTDIQEDYSSKIEEEDIMNLYKFVELPIQDENLNSLKRIRFSVVIESEGNKTCSLKENFFVNLRKTRNLHLSFMTLYYENNQNNRSSPCRVNEISDLSVLRDFAESEEVREFIPMSYPIAEDGLSSSFVTDRGIPALCDNTFFGNVSDGVLFDIARAEEEAFFHHTNNKISWTKKEEFPLFNTKSMVIVSKNYMKYHKRDESSGFMIKPSRKRNELGRSWIDGSWNVAFILENQINDGTVAHELAHLLGQEKEYYAERYKTGPKENNPLSDNEQDYWCRKFSEKSSPCYRYRIFGGLKAGFNLRRWRFLINKIPFMNEGSELKELWNDRDTFQRLFRTLHNENLDPTRSWSQTKVREDGIRERGTPLVSLLGVYDKKKRKFHKDFSVVYEKAWPGVSSPEGDIEVLLARRFKKGDSIKHKVLSKVKVETDLVMEVLSNEGDRRVHLSVVPVIARLPIPESDFRDKKVRKNLRLIVREGFQTLESNSKSNLPSSDVRKNPYIHNVSLRGAKLQKPEEKSVSKKRKILYDAPIDWDNKAEVFFMRRSE